MTRVMITGAAGFLGGRLLRKLLDLRKLGSKPISEIILVDLVAPALPEEERIKLTVLAGDLSNEQFLKDVAKTGFDSLFHFASFLTLRAETDPDTAFRVNVEALRQLIELSSNCPKVVFASSIAIFGGELPEKVGDTVNPLPTTTYGAHKAINELLIADYSRLGKIDGRCLRLPIVLTRPGSPTPAISDKIAGILREPLNGIDIKAPLAADTPVPIISAGAVINAFITLHDVPAAALPPKRAFNLPALTVTVQEMADTARTRGATGSVSFDPDPHMQAIVEGWPKVFVSETAPDLGITPDESLTALIDDYLDNKGL